MYFACCLKNNKNNLKTQHYSLKVNKNSRLHMVFSSFSLAPDYLFLDGLAHLAYLQICFNTCTTAAQREPHTRVPSDLGGLILWQGHLFLLMFNETVYLCTGSKTIRTNCNGNFRCDHTGSVKANNLHTVKAFSLGWLNF